MCVRVCVCLCVIQLGSSVTDLSIFSKLSQLWEEEFHKDMAALNVSWRLRGGGDVVAVASLVMLIGELGDLQDILELQRYFL